MSCQLRQLIFLREFDEILLPENIESINISFLMPKCIVYAL